MSPYWAYLQSDSIFCTLIFHTFQLCDTSSPDAEENSQIYSAPVAELGSTTNLNQASVGAAGAASETFKQRNGNTEKNGNALVEKHQKPSTASPLAAANSSEVAKAKKTSKACAAASASASEEPVSDILIQTHFHIVHRMNEKCFVVGRARVPDYSTQKAYYPSYPIL